MSATRTGGVGVAAGQAAAAGAGDPVDPEGSRLDRLLQLRVQASDRFFAAEAERLARLCHRMAERFIRGGRLIALGSTPAARSDVRHVAVEFVHPVIVGKRALPAIGLTGDGGRLAAEAALLVEPGDIVIGFGIGEARDAEGGEVGRALLQSGGLGCLTIAFAPCGAEWELVPPVGDALVAQEVVETLYHVLWELVHVFFEHRGLLAQRPAGARHDAGASAFLYPFLGEAESDLDAVLQDVRRSVLMKAQEIADLRVRTLTENRAGLIAAAAALRASFEAGGRMLALGNGGSATDATDAVADFRFPPANSGWAPRAALDLTEDPSILTAVANDIGPAAMFSRQVIAYGRPGDTLLAFSTSGGSENVVDALAEARRIGLTTIALVGYDGGRIAAEGLADHVLITRSQHIPRIQEAQASALHVLRELVELGAADRP